LETQKQTARKSPALLSGDHASERAEIGSTGITIYSDHWDSKLERITDHDPEAFFINEQLDIMRNQLRAIFNDLFRKREKISPAKIKRIYHGQGTNLTFLQAFAQYLVDSAADPERKLKKSSLEAYDNVRKKPRTTLDSATCLRKRISNGRNSRYERSIY
jgi:hypothetical protein